MITSPQTAEAKGYTDRISNRSFDSTRVHKSVKDSYQAGWSQAGFELRGKAIEDRRYAEQYEKAWHIAHRRTIGKNSVGSIGR